MEKSSFFNSVSHDRTYKAEDWAEYFASFIGNGVFPVPSTGLQVVANDGMKLNVKTGKAWINGYFYFNTGDLAVELDTADGQLNRIDRVVVRWDLTNRVMSVKVKSSSFSASPTAPALQRDADVYELALADIYVGAGVTAITQSKITDQRLNTSLCGVVAAVVQQIDTAAFNAQLQAWFAEYQSLSAAEYNTLVSYMDDFFLIHHDKAYLQECRKQIEAFVQARGLSLNAKTNIFPLKHGVDFLGFHTYLTESGAVIRKVRRRSKNNMKRKLKKLAALHAAGRIDAKTVEQSYQSWRGHAEKGNSYHLIRRTDQYYNSLMKSKEAAQCQKH